LTVFDDIFAGKRRGIANLWAFFGLSQILPISFAQNMFYLVLLKQSNTRREVDASPMFNSTIAAIYCAGLAYAPLTSGTMWLMPLIIAARLLLFSQLSLVRNSTLANNNNMMLRYQIALAVFGGTLILWRGYSALQIYSLDDIRKALFSHPAVSALGFDAILSILSFFAWIQRGLPALDGQLSSVITT
jgi:hypothetical protein